MINRHFRICPTLRGFLPIFLVTYLLLLTALLLKVPTDISQNIQSTSPFLTFSPQIRNPTFRDLDHISTHFSNVRVVNKLFLLRNGSKLSEQFPANPTTPSGKDATNFEVPKPLAIPLEVNNESGSFYHINKDFYIFSAYFDDRKKDIFIRLLTLAKQRTSRSSIFCHFKDEIYNVKRKALRYELCENHNKHFGGYVFSCEVPEFLNPTVSHQVTISYEESNDKLVIPLKTLRPIKDKLKFVDSYIGDMPHSTRLINDKNNILDQVRNKNSSQMNDKAVGGRVNGHKNNNDIHQTLNSKSGRLLPSLSFAVCVPPLFGEISVHRLIEYVELTLLLGAEHIFFYKFDVSDDVQQVLSHYVNKGVITLTQWSLPSNVTSDKIWYNGQLLAHNDCLYRSMPKFDLVAFNDIDEFIVPHDNESTTWSSVFPELISNSTCGLSFQSAFYDPGVKDMRDTKLLTPKLVAKTKQYSKVRSKVMLVPWRVFEVGIHHISKQNRENWTVQRVDTSTAFLHHYRRCVDSYDMNCSLFERDQTINRRYFLNLKRNYDKAISQIFSK